jgi:hypothetical protein
MISEMSIAQLHADPNFEYLDNIFGVMIVLFSGTPTGTEIIQEGGLVISSALAPVGFILL